MAKLKAAYHTSRGEIYQCKAEDFVSSDRFMRLRGRVQLLFTSPPFPLNRKKKYGNEVGDKYISWIKDVVGSLLPLLTPDGSIVLEIGNAWEARRPLMSTLPLRTLLSIMEGCELNLCQTFVYANPARLPSPVQWVNVKRIRVKDAYTNIWWLSKSEHPKADNRKVLQEYKPSMKKLLKGKKYNYGKRPSEHNIGKTSFLNDNGGSIPPNIIIASNTKSQSAYLEYCKMMDYIPHPARMPEAIPEFFIKLLTDEEDIVMDPFAGSNTTGAVAQQLKRRWISIELNESYVNASRGRFIQATGATV